MKEYMVVITSDENYISCSQKSYKIDADTYEDAVAKAERLLRARSYNDLQKDWPNDEPPFQTLDSTDEVDINSMIVYEISQETVIDVAKIRAEDRVRMAALRKKQNQDERRATYEKLRAEFEGQ